VPFLLFPERKFPAQGISQGIFSRKKKFLTESRMNSGCGQTGREFAGN